jgi:6-phosphogluconolactonase
MANIVVKADEAAVVAALASLVEREAREAIQQHGAFHLGLSGGSLAGFLCRGLPSIDTDWAAWRLFFCDERLVPVESPDNTWGLYRAGLLAQTPLTEQQVLVVRTDLPPEAAAKDYQEQLEARLAGRLDLLLLGAGPDGHTCSLFPGHPLLQEPALAAGGRLVASITDSPKPPPERVTLTLPAINGSGGCVFAACGAGKAGMMARLLGGAPGGEVLPAQLVKPVSGKLWWLLDQPAAVQLQMTMMAGRRS